MDTYHFLKLTIRTQHFRLHPRFVDTFVDTFFERTPCFMDFS